jgi:hypothetical protein
MSDLQFCRAISGKSEPWAIISNMPICSPSLNLVKWKVKLKFWWLHQSSQSLQEVISWNFKIYLLRGHIKIYQNLFKSWNKTWNKQTKIRREAIYISMTEFSSGPINRRFLAVFHDFWLKNLSPRKFSFKMEPNFFKVHLVTCLRFSKIIFGELDEFIKYFLPNNIGIMWFFDTWISRNRCKSSK